MKKNNNSSKTLGGLIKPCVFTGAKKQCEKFFYPGNYSFAIYRIEKEGEDTFFFVLSFEIRLTLGF
jgi:hypothetical protein